ncbi:hypothetical protein DSECCO2_582920 [anaerobic digester metagenome]
MAYALLQVQNHAYRLRTELRRPDPPDERVLHGQAAFGPGQPRRRDVEHEAFRIREGEGAHALGFTGQCDGQGQRLGSAQIKGRHGGDISGVRSADAEKKEERCAQSTHEVGKCSPGFRRIDHG